MKRQLLPADLVEALKAAERKPGWNSRKREVRRFELPRPAGEPFILYVVPYACWAYRRRDAVAANWRAQKAI
jgi:hypothetical protein